MGNGTVIIGVDTGNRCIKTASSVFLSGLQKSRIEPTLAQDTIFYDDSYYCLTKDRLPYLQDKALDDSYFVLTLFAVVKELQARGLSHNDTHAIHLAVGLPPSDMASMKRKFMKYFARKKIDFSYNKCEYSVAIEQVSVFVQGFSAIFADYGIIKEMPSAYIVDIGGYTTDVIAMQYGEVNTALCQSLDCGMIHLYNDIANKTKSNFALAVSEHVMDACLNDADKNLDCPDCVKNVVLGTASDYVNSLYRRILELRLDLAAATPIFIGGGAIRLRPWIEKSSFAAQSPLYISDIRANALGYEAFAASSES